MKRLSVTSVRGTLQETFPGFTFRDYRSDFRMQLHWLGISTLQLGFELDLRGPNLTLRLPGFFLTVGWPIATEVL